MATLKTTPATDERHRRAMTTEALLSAVRDRAERLYAEELAHHGDTSGLEGLLLLIGAAEKSAAGTIEAIERVGCP